MATITQTFLATAFQPVPGVAFPEMASAGTNLNVFSLKFDAGGVEAGQVAWRATAYGSGNITAKIVWFADTASADNVVWGACIAAITPNTDTQDVETDAWATENTATDSHLGTTGQRVHEIDITISNLDSVASGDACWLKIRRIGTDGADTMSGDAQLISVTLTYSDT